MVELADEMNVSPRQRITIPEGHSALIVSTSSLADIKSMLILLRKGKRLNPEDKFAVRSISGELLLAIMEAEVDAIEGKRV